MIRIDVYRVVPAAVLGMALALTGFAQQPQQSTQPGADQKQSDQLTAQDKQFLKDAAMASMTEVQIGRLAQDKSQNTEIQQYGQTLVTDHQKAQEKAKDLAQQYNVTLPQQIDQKHQQTVTRLQNLSGNQFDRQFVQAMVNDHQKAVDMFQNAARTSQNQDIRQFASDTVPVLQKHWDQAKNLQQTTQTSSTQSQERQTTMRTEEQTRTERETTTTREEGAEGLPATASNEALLLAVALFAFAAAFGLRLARIRI